MLRATLILSLLIGCASIVRAQETAQPTRECLQLDDRYAGHIVIDLARDAKIGGKIASTLPAQATVNGTRPTVLVSPDRQHAALTYSTADSGTALGLYPAYRTDSVVNFDTEANDGFRHSELRWSPYSQWLSFLSSRGDDGTYLSVVDPDGHMRQSVLISTRLEDSVSSYGWSADERYLAVSVSDSLGGPLRKIQIWSTPDLKLVKTLKPANAVGPVRFFSGELPTPDKIAWSPQGDTLAYLIYQYTGMDEQLSLNLYTPDVDQLTTADLPDLREPGDSALSWSADGQYVAVILVDKPDAQVARIDVIALDGTAQSAISENALFYRLLADGGVGYPLTFWSAHGHNLLFVEQLASQSPNLGALIGYDAASGQKRELAPHVYMNPNTAGDGQYLLARSPNDGLDENRYLNRDAVRPDDAKDSLVVVDTDQLKVTMLPAINRRPGMFQLYGSAINQAGWLRLEEDDLTTWAINTRSGASVPLFLPGELEQPYRDWPSYQLVSNGDLVARIQSLGYLNVRLSLRSLLDGTTRSIDHEFTGPIGAIAVNPGGDRTAVVSGDGVLDVFDSAGALLSSFDVPDAKLDFFGFITC